MTTTIDRRKWKTGNAYETAEQQVNERNGEMMRRPQRPEATLPQVTHPPLSVLHCQSESKLKDSLRSSLYIPSKCVRHT